MNLRQRGVEVLRQVHLAAEPGRLADRARAAGREQAPVVLSPAVPHRFYRHVSTDTYRDAVQGKADLVVEIRVRYRGPRGDEHCYLARDRFDPIDDFFYPQRGSLSCDQTAQPP